MDETQRGSVYESPVQRQPHAQNPICRAGWGVSSNKQG